MAEKEAPYKHKKSLLNMEYFRTFYAEPNEEAEILEKTLGIKIKEPPFKVPLNLRNRITYAMTHPFVDSLSEGIFLKNDAAGFYVREENIYYYWKGDKEESLKTALHENMHAYIFENSKLLRENDTKDERLFIQKSIKEKDPTSLEKYMCYISINEGIADWAESESYYKHRFGHFYSRKKNLREANRFHKSQISDDLTRYSRDKIRIENAQILEDFLSFTVQSDIKHSKNICNKLFNDYKKLGEIETAYYKLGYSFVYSAMSELRNRGLSIKDSLQQLLDLPPTQLSELKSPRTYSRKLLTC